MHYNKPNLVCYRIAQLISWPVATFVFRRKILRNEIKGVKGPFVVIANHESNWDFINLGSAVKRPISFVMSKSIYETLTFKSFMQRIGVIPKQQFQTTVGDMRRIKGVIEAGEVLVIYPAGLMSEDGLSTPIPRSTYKFLKWLDADVYVARTMGSYFVTPKWTKGIRPGRTYLDIYKLFSREELRNMEVNDIQEKTDKAILFDAYREQEELLVKYRGNRNIEGLENVLYMCPNCMTEFSMRVNNSNTLLPSLPFRPKEYLEVQHGQNIYRCVLDDGKLVMKYINMIKIYYETAHLPERRVENR